MTLAEKNLVMDLVLKKISKEDVPKGNPAYSYSYLYQG